MTSRAATGTVLDLPTGPIAGSVAGTVEDTAHRLLSAALDIVELLIDEIIEPATDQDLTKEIGEVSMLLRLAHRVGVGPDRIQGIAGRIEPRARGAAVRRNVAGRPSRAAVHVLAHACLADVGLPDAGFEALARAALESSVASAAERVPYRLLDVAWIRQLILGDQELDHHALPLSPIGQGVDLIGATIEDAYAFSHALPYATDFGRLELPAWADREMLISTADALILKALDDDDLDLLGELLMVPCLLRTPWSALQWFGWQVLVSAWAEYGFLPGPGLPPRPAGESRSAAVHRVLGTVYHTTLVGGLLMATAISTDCLPPAVPPGAEDGEPEPVFGPRAWHRAWAKLPVDQQRRLTAVPAGMELQQASGVHDVGRMIRALRGPTLPLLPHVLAIQTSEHLARVALLISG